MALDTVGDYLARARVLLQDEVEPYRYETSELIQSLNEAFMEVARLRPDFFLVSYGTHKIPDYTATTDVVNFPHQYRTALIYYIVGNAHLRDEEDTQDKRSAVLLNKFVAQLLTIPS